VVRRYVKYDDGRCSMAPVVICMNRRMAVKSDAFYLGFGAFHSRHHVGNRTVFNQRPQKGIFSHSLQFGQQERKSVRKSAAGDCSAFRTQEQARSEGALLRPLPCPACAAVGPSHDDLKRCAVSRTSAKRATPTSGAAYARTPHSERWLCNNCVTCLPSLHASCR
jgi:hypothetical protein